jgi:hypothetical protein
MKTGGRRVSGDFVGRFVTLLKQDRHQSISKLAAQLGCTWKTAKDWQSRALAALDRELEASKLGVAKEMLLRAEDPQHRAQLATLNQDLDTRLLTATKGTLATCVAVANKLAGYGQKLAQRIEREDAERLPVRDAFVYLARTSGFVKSISLSMAEISRVSELLQGRPTERVEVENKKPVPLAEQERLGHAYLEAVQRARLREMETVAAEKGGGEAWERGSGSLVN